jgi:hypothetical protein
MNMMGSRGITDPQIAALEALVGLREALDEPALKRLWAEITAARADLEERAAELDSREAALKAREARIRAIIEAP